MKQILLSLLFLFPGLTLAAGPTPAATQEISHLFSYLKSSGCEFSRNGSWHSGEEAVAHLNAKYEYFLKKNLISSAEDFIERAATASSMTGTSYLVRCGTSSPVQSAAWFRAELARYRNNGR